jgi:hypothetical protein
VFSSLTTPFKVAISAHVLKMQSFGESLSARHSPAEFLFEQQIHWHGYKERLGSGRLGISLVAVTAPGG